MAACEAWSSGRARFSYLLPCCFHFRFFFICAILFCLRGFSFICLFSFLFACFPFFLFVFSFLYAWFLFICVVSFLFASFLFYFRVFFFVCVVSFFVCSMSLEGHRKILNEPNLASLICQERHLNYI